MRKILYALAPAAIAATACSKDAPPPAAPGAYPGAEVGQPRAVRDPAPESLYGVTAFVDPGGGGSRRPVTELVAVLHSTETGKPIGTTRFVDSGQGALHLFTMIDGLSPGRHAYHVHVFGDCSAPDATSAGPHFHFTGSSFDKSVNIVTGNLGELTVDAEGKAVHEVQRALAKIHGPFSLIGRAVVIHEGPNDPLSPPDGAAGARIACGVIGIGNSASASGPSAQR
jgi:Cu-Zn family superoxide dismutase